MLTRGKYSLRRMLRPDGAAPFPFRRLAAYVTNAEVLVIAFYGCSVYMCAAILVDVRRLVDTDPTWDFLWPLAWVPYVGPTPTLEIVAILALVASVLALVLRTQVWARAAFFVLFAMAASVMNSIGCMNHPYHAWIWVALVFVFLPGGRPATLDRDRRMAYLTTILAAQALILLFYTMAGFWKVWAGIEAIIADTPGNFSIGALGWQLADRKLQTGTNPILAEFVISTPLISTMLFLGVIYIQLVAIIVAFRPRLHMIWGGFLILFHLGTWMLMDIIFRENLVLLAILFLLSPQRDMLDRPGAVLRDLPIFGWIFRLVVRAAPGAAPEAVGR